MQFTTLIVLLFFERRGGNGAKRQWVLRFPWAWGGDRLAVEEVAEGEAAEGMETAFIWLQAFALSHADEVGECAGGQQVLQRPHSVCARGRIPYPRRRGQRFLPLSCRTCQGPPRSQFSGICSKLFLHVTDGVCSIGVGILPSHLQNIAVSQACNCASRWIWLS